MSFFLLKQKSIYFPFNTKNSQKVNEEYVKDNRFYFFDNQRNIFNYKISYIPFHSLMQ